MIIAAGVAAQAASALFKSLQGNGASRPGAGSAGTDFQNLTSDLGALLPGAAPAGTGGSGSGTGSITGDLSALGQDVLSGLGFGSSASATAPAAAAQAYGTASSLGT